MKNESEMGFSNLGVGETTLSSFVSTGAVSFFAPLYSESISEKLFVGT